MGRNCVSLVLTLTCIELTGGVSLSESFRRSTDFINNGGNFMKAKKLLSIILALVNASAEDVSYKE